MHSPSNSDACTFDAQAPLSRRQSLRFLRAIRGLLRRVSTISISARSTRSVSSRNGSLYRFDSDYSSLENSHSRKTSCATSHTRSTSSTSYNSAPSWKRRGQTPGMGDYLTLSQLENLWMAQECYLGCIYVPQEIDEYNYQEAVEAPVMVKHDIINRPDEPSPPLPPPKDHGPQILIHDESTNIIDGAVHPALRSRPYLSSPSTLSLRPRSLHPRPLQPRPLQPRPLQTRPVQSNPQPPRLAITVPHTLWTYGRD